jgi:hypothetical protein
MWISRDVEMVVLTGARQNGKTFLLTQSKMPLVMTRGDVEKSKESLGEAAPGADTDPDFEWRCRIYRSNSHSARRSIVACNLFSKRSSQSLRIPNVIGQ